MDALEKLKGRESVVLKRYNMETYARSKETITVSPADVVILEGILVLYSARVRALLDMTLFVDLDSGAWLTRSNPVRGPPVVGGWVWVGG